MKEDKQIEFIASTHIEVYHIHDAVSFLEKVQGLFPLFSLDKLNGRVVKFAKNYWDFIFRDTKLLVVVFVESIILIESASL
jgi:hypothetical protein